VFVSWPTRKKTSQQAEPIRPRLLRIKDAAKYLALTPYSMRELARAGTIPFIQVGHRWLFDIRELDRFVEHNAGARF
jgi:excisionase family DNA binding protein